MEPAVANTVSNKRLSLSSVSFALEFVVMVSFLQEAKKTTKQISSMVEIVFTKCKNKEEELNACNSSVKLR